MCTSHYLSYSCGWQWADKAREELWRSNTNVPTWTTTMEALSTEKPNINNLCCFMSSQLRTWHRLRILQETPQDSVLHGKNTRTTGSACSEIVRRRTARRFCFIKAHCIPGSHSISRYGGKRRHQASAPSVSAAKATDTCYQHLHLHISNINTSVQHVLFHLVKCIGKSSKGVIQRVFWGRWSLN